MKQKSIYKIVNIETGFEDYGDYTLIQADKKLQDNFEMRTVLRIVPRDFVKVFLNNQYQWGAPDDNRESQ